jgi:hypothetical protein
MNAATRIAYNQDRIRYKKVGNKYVQCNDYDAYEGLADGWWLVKVEPYSKTIRACVHPHRAEVQAAAIDKQEQLIKIIDKAAQFRPKEGIPLSEQARIDWEFFISKHGKEFSILYGPSYHDCAKEIVETLLAR